MRMRMLPHLGSRDLTDVCLPFPGRGRWIARLAALAVALFSILDGVPATAFTFEDVALRAKQLADASFKKPTSSLPKELQNLDYDQYRDIRFKPAEAYWRDAKLPFELEFFHQGWHFDQAVKINEVAGQAVREIKFDPTLFDYGANKIHPNQMRGLGFAGFRVHYPINTKKYKDEVLVFLGASYFRAVGKGQLYGLSARGLAVDTALTSGEEFPRFVEFWIDRPKRSAKELTIYGLLDSRRLTGAYQFVLMPGNGTALEVKARLYLRDGIGKLGLAPLTSMFFFGEVQGPRVDDYRPEVHDSDGLSILTGTGEWIWRPLSNPQRLLVTSFAATDPRGFGLMQRDREFRHYEDLEARYEMRPSAWVEPKGSWGPGRIELVQIPVGDETNDNIVAYWIPDNRPQPKRAYDFAYRLLWQKDPETRPPLSWVTQTRRGHGYSRRRDGSIGFVVDFDGPALRTLPAEAKLDGVVWTDSNGQVMERNAYRNAVTGGWRLTVRLRRHDDNKPLELRAHLSSGSDVLSETWSHIIPPE
jgi:glucans biosynthesis protein